MTQEQREALVRWHVGDLFDDDFSVMAEAYAAEHPADDDVDITLLKDAQATEDLIESLVGPITRGAYARAELKTMCGMVLVVYSDGQIRTMKHGELVVHAKTRGQLRRLIAALKGE
jgi:hypothetical protein